MIGNFNEFSFLFYFNLIIRVKNIINLPNLTINFDKLVFFFLQGMASFLWDASYFKKSGFKIMVNMLDTKMFVTTSINNCLWNLTDPLVQSVKRIMPSLVPEENMGILKQVTQFINCFKYIL